MKKKALNHSFGFTLIPLLIALGIIAVIAGGAYFGVKHFKPNQPQPKQSVTANFIKEGNIVADCTFLYEEPGNPAIPLKLMFTDSSQGHIQGKLTCGQKVRVEGKKENDQVIVASLTKIGTNQETQVCCVPKTEPEPESSIPSDWQVFTHTSPNFTFKYPANYKIDVSKNPTMGKLEFVTAYQGVDTFGSVCNMGIKMWDNPLTADQDYDRTHASENESVTIDDKPAQKYYTPANAQIPRDVYNYYLDDPLAGIYLSIGLVQNSGSNCSIELEKMLSTLNFND